MNRREQAQAHAQRGQERFCQLSLWAKNVTVVDPETVLLALTVSAGQFVKSHSEHASLVLTTAKELGINCQSWVKNPIQDALHRRRLAQSRKNHDFCGFERGDPRIKWSGETYQKRLDISDEVAHEFGLTEIVGDKLARAIKRARKTKDQWRAQTQKATQARQEKADRNAILAQHMRINGCSVKLISDRLDVCTQTVRNYLIRLVAKVRSCDCITTPISENQSDKTNALRLLGTVSDKRKALSSKTAPVFCLFLEIET